MQIRLVTPDDAAAIAAIYAPIVQRTHISFEETPPTPQEMRERIARYTTTHPWLVAVRDHAVTGFAYATYHRSREAYRWSTDCSVYVAQEARRCGTGKALYAQLFERLKRQGFHNVFAGIALPNDASIALHRALGFTHVGVYHDVGYKFGRWYDTSWWQLKLRSGGVPNEPLAVATNSSDRP